VQISQEALHRLQQAMAAGQIGAKFVAQNEHVQHHEVP
jgi:hypothetical protein